MHRLRSRRRRRFAWIRRRGWVLAVAPLLVTATAVGLSGARQPHYTSVAVLVVQSGASDTGPGSANEAATLGVTYAGLIPQDSQLVRYVAGRLGLSAHDIERDVSVSIESGTSLLLVNFSNPSASVSLAGAQLVAKAISGPTPVTPTIPAGSVALVHLPTVASRSASSWHKAAALGIILGLALGAALIVLWERADPRVDDATDLVHDVRFPVWDAEDLEVGLASALLPRWRSIARRGRLETVALIAVGNCIPEAELQVAQVLRDAAHVPIEDSSPTTDHRAGLVPQIKMVGFDIGTLRPTAARWLADADFRALLVPSGHRYADVVSALATLAELDVVPAWGFVLSPAKGRNSASLALTQGSPTALPEDALVPAIPESGALERGADGTREADEAEPTVTRPATDVDDAAEGDPPAGTTEGSQAAAGAARRPPTRVRRRR